MHPAIPILVMAALISLLEEDKKPPPPPERPKERVVLLPDADGKTGSLVVITPRGETAPTCTLKARWIAGKRMRRPYRTALRRP
jgi:hypothetical protein